MTVFVNNSLEVVHVEKNKAQFLLFGRGGIQVLVEIVVQKTRVVKAGYIICNAQFL